MDNRKYKIKRWGKRIIMDATTLPGWKRVISKGDLHVYLSDSNESVVQIARYMRIRPENVFQDLSDAFDKSLLQHTIIVKDGCIHFDCDIATITLDPGKDGHSWKLLYNAKEEMFNRDFSPHPDDAYTIPETLYNDNVKLSFVRIEPLVRMVWGEGHSPSVGVFDILNRHYCEALRKETILRVGNMLTFYSGLSSQNKKDVYVTIEPDYLNPIPGFWHITRIGEHYRYETSTRG